jgi:hypothetical protein
MAALQNNGFPGDGAGHAVASWGERRARALRYAAEVSQIEKGTLSSSLAIMASFHPPLHKRLERLVAMGATSVATRPRGGMPRLAVYLIIAPLLALCGVLMTIALGLIYMLALFADMMVITVVLIIVLTVLGVKV